jgi:AraC family transcriptional regulator, transcriptional activator of pobA
LTATRMANSIATDDHVKSLADKDFDLLHINESGMRNYDGSLPHRHTFFELFVFEEKGYVHEIDFNKYPVEQYSVHFVSPAQVHKLIHRNAKGILFCFNESFVRLPAGKKIADVFPFYSLDAHRPLVRLTKKEFEELAEFIKMISSEFFSGSTYRFDIISALLSAYLLKLKEKYITSGEKNFNSKTKKDALIAKHPYVRQFILLIDKNFDQHLSVQEYAEKLNISPNYLNALCKQELGKTAVGLVHERILLEAKRLLYSTMLTAKEISSELNFEDTAYFNRFFKKHTGQTPLFFRQTAGQ